MTEMEIEIRTSGFISCSKMKQKRKDEKCILEHVISNFRFQILFWAFATVSFNERNGIGVVCVGEFASVAHLPSVANKTEDGSMPLPLEGAENAPKLNHR